MKILFFSANWCGQCKVVKPKFIELCKKYNFDNYQIIDADEDSEKVDDYAIKNLPTAIFIFNENNKTKVIREIGFDILKETETQLANICKVCTN